MIRNAARSILLIWLFTILLQANDFSPEALIEAGHWKKARAILELRIRADPQDAPAAYLLSQVKMAFGDLDGALGLAQRAVAIERNNANYHFQLAQVFGEMADRASIFAAGGLAGKFKHELGVALALDAKNLDALEARMQFCFQAPRLMGGDRNQAHAISKEIWRLNPVRGFLAQAELAKQEKDAARVESLYLKALEADPKNCHAQISLADFFNSPAQKKYELAEKHAREALKLDAGRVRGYSILARVFALQQRWSELDAILAAAEKTVPDDLAPFFEAGNALLETGEDLARAEACLRKYLTQEPEGEEPDAARARRLLELALKRQRRKA